MRPRPNTGLGRFLYSRISRGTASEANVVACEHHLNHEDVTSNANEEIVDFRVSAYEQYHISKVMLLLFRTKYGEHLLG